MNRRSTTKVLRSKSSRTQRQPTAKSKRSKEEVKTKRKVLKCKENRLKMIRQANFLNHRIKFDSELKSKIEKKLSTEAFKYTMKKYKGEYKEIMNESRSLRRSQNKFVP